MDTSFVVGLSIGLMIGWCAGGAVMFALKFLQERRLTAKGRNRAS